jgi:hypothetical protein
MVGVAATALAVVLVALGACGSDGTGGQPSSRSPSIALPTASPCPAGVAPATPAPIREAQALAVIHILVTAGVATSRGGLQLGTVSCVSVGIGQVVSLVIDARMPPVPAEPQGSHLLSAITVTPAVRSGPGVPARYTVTFAAATPGTTTLAYLPATCNLPPGAC